MAKEFAPWEEHASDVSDVPESNPHSLGNQAKKMVYDAGGFAQAGLDTVGSLPGMALGIPGFVEEMIRDKEPKEAFEHLMGFASENNILNHLPQDMLKLRDTEGYEVANKALAKSIGIFGQGAGNIAGVAGASPKGAEFADVGTQIGLMAGGMLGRGAKRGSPEWYRQQRENAPTTSLKDQAAIRESYNQPETAPWEMDVRGFREPPHEAFAPGINDTSMPFRAGDTGMDAYRPPNPQDISIQRGMEEEPSGYTPEKGLDVTPELPQPRMELAPWEMTLSDTAVGKRDKPDLRDFEQMQRDRSNEANFADRQPLGPDELQRGPEEPPMPGAYEPAPFEKPRLKAELPYEYENPIEFEKAVAEEYRPEVRDGRMRTPEQNARFSDNTLGEFYDGQLATKLLHSTIRRDILKQEREPGGKPVGLNPVRIGLEHIQNKSNVPYYRELAKKLLGDPEFKPDLELVKNFGDRKTKAGDYSLDTHKIRMREGLIGAEQLLLHEAVHARVMGPIHAYLSWKKSGGTLKSFERHFTHLKAPIERIISLYEGLEKQHVGKFGSRLGAHNLDFPETPASRSGRAYGMTDVHEFVAEGFTNPSFQADLAQMKIPRELSNKGKYQFYWDAFLDSVKDMLGLKGERANTYLSELLRAGSDLMEGTGSKERIYYADMMDMDVQLGARIEDLHRKGVAGSLQEAAREFRLDKRPIEQMIDQDMRPLKKIEDFTAKDSNYLWQVAMRLGSLVKENLLQDTTLGQIMKEKPGTGQAIRWTVDQVSRIEREATIKTKEALDTALKPFRRMYHDKKARAELIEGWKKWQENIGVRDLTRADFVTERQWNIYRNFQAVHDKILDELNAKRESAGLQPIQRIPSYFHAAWEGDYRVFGYKADGTKVWAQGFKTEWQAKKAVDAFRKAHPDLKIADPEHIATDKYDLHTGRINAFEDAIRTMSADDPATKALQRTYRDILQHKGFGRTGVHRQGILGFLGSEDGALGLRMMERSFDQYVNQAYRYMGNLEKQQVLADLQKIPLEMRKQMPETMDFLYSYLKKTQGAKLDTMAWDKLAMQLSKAVGLGEGGPKRLIRGGANIATLYWLTTPRFLISQMGQYANAIPKMFQQFGVIDGSKAWVDGIRQTLNPDSVALEGADWAAKRGYLDPTIKNMLTGDPYEVPVGSKMQAFREVASYPAALIEHHMVRLPTFMAFEKALRPFIKDKELRFQEAAEKTDYYMVNYGAVHSPMVYDKLGIAGVAARPLKQYAHNTWGQFIEYVKGLKDRGEVAPVASFLGVQAAMSGLKGVMLVAEATAIITLLNAMFSLDIDTPEQLMLKSGLHESLVFGGMSTVLHHDISSSMSAPSLPQMFSFPAISFGIGVAADAGNYLVKLAKGQDTERDRARAALALTPNLMHEWIKNFYTPTGEPTINPGDPDMRGNYRRSEAERWMAAFIGAKPLQEAKIDAMMRAAKQELKRDMVQRMNALDAIVDRVQQGKEVSPFLFQRYIQEGGDPSRLSANLMRTLKERSMTGPERSFDVRAPISNTQFQKLDKIQEYLDGVTEGKPPLGFDPDTGSIKPLAEERDPKTKQRIYNDTEGSPDLQSFIARKVEPMYQNSVYGKKGPGPDPEGVYEFPLGDSVKRPMAPEGGKPFEERYYKRRREQQQRKYRT